MTKKWLTLAMLLVTTLALGACGDTWRNFRQDTGENLEATGRAVEDAGEQVRPQP